MRRLPSHDPVVRAAALAAVPVLLLLPLSWLVGAVWVGEFVEPWRPHLGALLVLLGGVALLRGASLGLGLALLGVVHAFVAVPRMLPRSAVPGDHQLDLALLNVHAANDAHHAVRAWVDEVDADVVVLVELTPALAAALDDPRYPHRALLPHARDEFGVGVWSKRPLTDVVEGELRGYVATLRVTVDVGGDPLTLAVTHAPPPLSPGLVADRSAVITAVAADLRAHGGRSVMLGDLNLTPWSPHLRLLRGQARLEDGAAGFGPAPTWPAFLGPLGIPIDHVLVSSDVAVLDYVTVPSPGSDHRAVLARLSW